MRPSDDCLTHDEIAEEQEYVRYADYADLKAEVERLTELNKKIMSTADIIDASNQRLIKAGDAVVRTYAGNEASDCGVCLDVVYRSNDLVKAWLAAKNLNS
jgi:hypothetical protein